MSDPIHLKRNDFLTQFNGLRRGRDACADLDLRGSLRLGKATLRLPPPTLPLQILLGDEAGYRLHLYPEMVLNGEGDLGHQGNYLLLDPQNYFSDISGFMRLHAGDCLTLGRDDPMQRLLLRYPRTVAPQHLRLKLSASELCIKTRSSTAGACIAPLTAADLMERMTRWRYRHINRLTRLLGGSIAPLGRAPAMELITQVLNLMEQEPYRALNHLGRPGGLLVLPDRVRPIFVGDLRARVDNLLVILSQNGFLEALEEGSAILIILGNAVHPDRAEQAAEMESSMLMMDLIFRLKLRFPERVFYLRGHQDSFSEALSHAGLPQGSLWEDALHQARGPDYRDAMQQFYERLPLVAATTRFLAAHAGMPIDALGWQCLVDIDRHPDLADRITRPSPSGPGSKAPYGRRELTRMLGRIGLARDASCILGAPATAPSNTYAMTKESTLQQFRLYSAGPDWVSTLTRAHKHLMPLRYPAEPVTAVYHRLRSTETHGR